MQMEPIQAPAIFIPPLGNRLKQPASSKPLKAVATGKINFSLFCFSIFFNGIIVIDKPAVVKTDHAVTTQLPKCSETLKKSSNVAERKNKGEDMSSNATSINRLETLVQAKHACVNIIWERGLWFVLVFLLLAAFFYRSQIEHPCVCF